MRENLAQTILSLKIVAFDFDGVFTDNSVYLTQDGIETVRCSRSAGPGLRRLEAVGLLPIIISTETNPVVTTRAGKLQIEALQAIQNKRSVLDKLCVAHDCTLDEIAFVGNDINDLPALKVVGLPIVVRDAYPGIIQYARYQTTLPGGHGAVREVCDLIYSIRTREQS